MIFFRNFLSNRSIGLTAFAAFVFVLGLSSAGCNTADVSSPTAAGNVAKTETESNAPSNGNAESKQSESAKGSLCSLDHYPVAADRKLDFEVTGAGAESFSLAQTDVTDSGFIEKRTFSSGLVITNNWVCEPDGIRNVEFTNTGIMKNADFTVETLKSSGVTLPREITVGKQFESTYDIKANVNANGLKADATGKVSSSSKVVSLEDEVIIKDKLYKAIKIDSVIKINITVSGRGYEAANLKTSNWYVPGIGLVKQDTKSSLGNQVVTLNN